jgi:hypothetical protein
LKILKSAVAATAVDATVAVVDGGGAGGGGGCEEKEEAVPQAQGPQPVNRVRSHEPCLAASPLCPASVRVSLQPPSFHL